MVRTVSIRAEIGDDHTVHIAVPVDIPVGPAEIVLVVVPQEAAAKHTLGELMESEFFGMWKNRTDIQDTSDFARDLRERAWRRSA